jgi:predicted DCC family thiol-disulfide oxidoreductase YuxK
LPALTSDLRAQEAHQGHWEQESDPDRDPVAPDEDELDDPDLLPEDADEELEWESHPDGRALLLYDRDCRFCRWALRRVLTWDRGRRLRVVALQEPRAARLLGDLDEPRRMASWHLIAADGSRASAGEAVAPLLSLLPGGRPLARLARACPRAVQAAYETIARHRSTLSRLLARLGAD